MRPKMGDFFLEKRKKSTLSIAEGQPTLYQRSGNRIFFIKNLIYLSLPPSAFYNFV